MRPALLALALLPLQGFATREDPSKKPGPLGTQGGPEEATRRPPPPPKSIAGIHGIESVSTLLYSTAPDRPHQLRATYVFPERVRWQISAQKGNKTERLLQYRFGETVYRLPSRAAASEVCSGVDRTQTLLQMELRRALMLYPDGFDWIGNGLERHADLGELGSLFARYAAASDKKPTELGDNGSDGKAIDLYKAISWREIGGRVRPASMELWHSGEIVWKETIESIDVQGRFVDSYFLPPDRRDRSGSEPLAGSVRDLDLPAICSLRIEFPKGTTWDGALAELTRQRADWSTRLAGQKLELDPNATIEISRGGEPTTVLLRLSTVPEKPPPGFLMTGPRTGLALAVQGLREATTVRISDLQRALPKGSIEEIPYVRFDTREGTEARILIVLPYSRSR